MSLLQYFVVERIAVISWLQENATANPAVNYDYANYFVSDLGAHLCQQRDVTTTYSRWICSPLFAVADLSFIVFGFGVICSSLLITSTVLRVGGHYERFEEEERWQSTMENHIKAAHHDAEDASQLRLLVRHIGGEHYGRKLTWRHFLTFFFRFFMLMAGIALVGLGSYPEDYDQDVHSATTTVFLIFAVTALITLGIIWWTPSRLASVLIILSAIAGAAGGLAMLVALQRDLAGVPRGFYERLVVYGFIAGVVIMGFALATGARAARREMRSSLHPT